MNTDNNNHEPTTPVNYTNPYMMHESNIPPPPPPEYYMHQRTGKAWKVAIPFVLILFGLALGLLIYPMINALHHPTIASSPTPFVPFSLPPTKAQTTILHPTNTTAIGASSSGLYSQDFNSFYGTFIQDMTAGKYEDISSSVGSSFQLSCDNSPSPPCAYGWLSVYHMLIGGHLTFSFPYNGTYIYDSCKNIPYPINADTYTVVRYDQDGSINAPSSGDAVLDFGDEAISDNTNQWFWGGVILQGSC